jgi:uncharacterized membrane protein
MKNIIKATLYVLIGTVGIIGALVFVGYSFFSSTFIPVYVGSTYVLANQLVRYMLYFIALVVIMFSYVLAGYGLDYLIKKFKSHSKKRR